MRLLAALLLCAAPAPAQNLLVLLADDVGVDRVAAYGEHPQPGRTPQLDALAARGVLFRNAWAYPTCSPARAALLTGRHASRTGIGRITGIGRGFGLLESETTLPEMLGEGWSSAAIGKWHLASAIAGPYHANRAGFALYAGNRFNFSAVGDDYFDWGRTVQGVLFRSTRYATSQSVDDALRMVTTLPEPWLVYVALHAPHAPLHRPPGDLHTFALGPTVDPVLYTKAMIEAMDTEIGRLLAAVDEERTTVVFLGDNGTSRPATSAPFVRAHAKGTLYEGGLNVPLIVAGEAVRRNGECAALVSVTDLYATFAELAGRPSAAEDSVSLVPYLRDPTHPSLRTTVFAERFGPNGLGPRKWHQRAIRDARYKLIVDVKRGGQELYDLATDPFEATNLLDAPLAPEAAVALAALRREMTDLVAGF